MKVSVSESPSCEICCAHDTATGSAIACTFLPLLHFALRAIRYCHCSQSHLRFSRSYTEIADCPARLRETATTFAIARSHATPGRSLLEALGGGDRAVARLGFVFVDAGGPA